MVAPAASPLRAINKDARAPTILTARRRCSLPDEASSRCIRGRAFGWSRAHLRISLSVLEGISDIASELDAASIDEETEFSRSDWRDHLNRRICARRPRRHNTGRTSTVLSLKTAIYVAA